VLLPLASQQSELNASVVVLVFGLIIGVFGHVIGSRTLIITGILIIALFSALFAFGAGHLS
jgi:hypothetical protein